jgi:hypothetical protein
MTKEELINIAYDEAVSVAFSSGEHDVNVDNILAQLGTGDLLDLQAAAMHDLIRDQIRSWARKKGMTLKEG